jgi:hypothetical protein
MKKTIQVAAIACLLAAAPLGAATLLEMRDGDGGVQRMWVEGAKLRVEPDGMPMYMLMDLDTGTMLMVDTDEQHIMEMSGMAEDMPRADPAPEGEARLVKRGAGPTIAGYATEHYVLQVGELACGEEFVSRKALQEAGLERMARRMAAMGGMEQMLGVDAEPCDAAVDLLHREIPRIGMPLRSVDREGRVEMEVVRIERGAALPAGGFEPPAGYARMNMQELLQQMMQ